jgi:hypothetical protein
LRALSRAGWKEGEIADWEKYELAFNAHQEDVRYVSISLVLFLT